MSPLGFVAEVTHIQPEKGFEFVTIAHNVPRGSIVTLGVPYDPGHAPMQGERVIWFPTLRKLRLDDGYDATAYEL